MTRMNLKHYEGYLAYLKQQEKELQESLGQVKESITICENDIANIRSASSSNGHTARYSQFENVADAAKAFLASGNGGWRRPAVIAKALLTGGFVTRASNFRSNLNTALKRRSSSDKALIKGRRGWRCQAPTAPK